MSLARARHTVVLSLLLRTARARCCTTTTHDCSAPRASAHQGVVRGWGRWWVVAVVRCTVAPYSCLNLSEARRQNHSARAWWCWCARPRPARATTPKQQERGGRSARGVGRRRHGRRVHCLLLVAPRQCKTKSEGRGGDGRVHCLLVLSSAAVRRRPLVGRPLLRRPARARAAQRTTSNSALPTSSSTSSSTGSVRYFELLRGVSERTNIESVVILLLQ